MLLVREEMGNEQPTNSLTRNDSANKQTPQGMALRTGSRPARAHAPLLPGICAVGTRGKGDHREGAEGVGREQGGVVERVEREEVRYEMVFFSLPLHTPPSVHSDALPRDVRAVVAGEEAQHRGAC